MAAGTAIVATKVAGTVEVMNETLGMLVPPDDIDAICNAVLSLCKDEIKRKQIGMSARADVVSKYSWNYLSERFIEVCKSSLKDSILVR